VWSPREGCVCLTFDLDPSNHPPAERSARSTFPDLVNFRPARLRGWRRVFAHTADVFYARGIARPETGEVSSLSCEPTGGGGELVVALFEVPFSPEAVKAFIEREHVSQWTDRPIVHLLVKFQAQWDGTCFVLRLIPKHATAPSIRPRSFGLSLSSPRRWTAGRSGWRWVAGRGRTRHPFVCQPTTSHFLSSDLGWHRYPLIFQLTPPPHPHPPPHPPGAVRHEHRRSLPGHPLPPRRVGAAVGQVGRGTGVAGRRAAVQVRVWYCGFFCSRCLHAYGESMQSNPTQLQPNPCARAPSPMQKQGVPPPLRPGRQVLLPRGLRVIPGRHDAL
jgi:hypothetical protein